MPRMGFEPTIPVLEWAKRFHALDRAATVIGTNARSCAKCLKQVAHAVNGQYIARTSHSNRAAIPHSSRPQLASHCCALHGQGWCKSQAWTRPSRAGYRSRVLVSTPTWLPTGTHDNSVMVFIPDFEYRPLRHSRFTCKKWPLLQNGWIVSTV
jgi:hypothetical protein